MAEVSEKTQSHRSEVARLMDQIRKEYEAAEQGLTGTAQGQSRHSFITTRMENLGKLQTELEELIGESAIAFVIQVTNGEAASSQ